VVAAAGVESPGAEVVAVGAGAGVLAGDVAVFAYDAGVAGAAGVPCAVDGVGSAALAPAACTGADALFAISPEGATVCCASAGRGMAARIASVTIPKARRLI